MAAGYTKYFDVEQKSAKWHEIRRPIGGSTVGGLIGFSQYKAPGHDATKQEFNKYQLAALKHGEIHEPFSAKAFITWASSWGNTTDDVRTQTYDENPGYDIPIHPHPHFVNEDDARYFGVSLDMRGSVIDVEIKNPTTYKSFYYAYLSTIQPVYFIQTQWAMAMRNRKEMFFVATSFEQGTTNETGEPIRLGIVIWKVKFAERFFTDIIYPLARKVATGETSDIPWVNQGNAYSASHEYKTLFNEHCERVYVWKNSAYITKKISAGEFK